MRERESIACHAGSVAVTAPLDREMLTGALLAGQTAVCDIRVNGEKENTGIFSILWTVRTSYDFNG